MIEFLVMLIVSFPGVASFVVGSLVPPAVAPLVPPTTGRAPTPVFLPHLSHLPLAGAVNTCSYHRRRTAMKLAMETTAPNKTKREPGCITWSPQDLTQDTLGCCPIPDDDYIKLYQQNPELWPVEFFLIVHRRIQHQGKRTTQLLVRTSANGTSQWGLGTGVPATRWMPSSQPRPPPGYTWSEPKIEFEARQFPEFPQHETSWSYTKIDISEDAFRGDPALQDLELQEYARQIRNELRTQLSKQQDGTNLSSWEACRLSVVQDVVDKDNSLAAIQGTLRMSGLFCRRDDDEVSQPAVDAPRCLSLDHAPNPATLAQSVRIYTMFPQMPDPLPHPSTPPQELQEELTSRESRVKQSGRDPHQDKYGRRYTHKSTSNVSNTIHGVYLTLDATDLPGRLEEVPALDLFGTEKLTREWKSLEDLQVLDSDGKTISTQDPKPTFISGFIARQLVKEGIIGIHR